MPYTKHTWVDSTDHHAAPPGGGPALNATTMNEMEAGIAGAHLVYNVADHASIQAAINACSAAGGGVVQLGVGMTTLTTGITIPAHVRVRGRGRVTTILSWNSATGDMISLTGDNATLTDLTVQQGATTPTSGALVVLSAGGFQHIDAVSIVGGYDNIRGDNSYGWVFSRGYNVSPIRHGMFLRSILEPDRGDSSITSTVFDTGIDSTAAIRYESGGGLKISTTKILDFDYGIDLQVSDGTATSVFTLAGCSVENQDIACIRLGRAGTTGSYTELLIVGNQINGNVIGDGIILGTGVEDVTIVGNTIKGPLAKTGITIGALQRCVIEGNNFRGWDTAIVKGNAAPRVIVGTNNYGAATTPLIDDSPQNLPFPGLALRTHVVSMSTTSTTTYTNLYRVELNVYRGAQLDLTIEGLLGNAGNVTRHIRCLVNRDAGNITVTTISDTAAGVACDVQFDVTTTAGSVILGVRRNAAAGGTQLDATVTLSADGGVRSIRIL